MGGGSGSVRRLCSAWVQMLYIGWGMEWGRDIDVCREVFGIVGGKSGLKSVK